MGGECLSVMVKTTLLPKKTPPKPSSAILIGIIISGSMPSRRNILNSDITFVPHKTDSGVVVLGEKLIIFQV